MSRTHAITEELTYRLSTDEDIPGLLDLWEEETLEGRLSEQTWREWHDDSPNGPCIIPIALIGNRVVGQAVFTPSFLWIRGQDGASRRVPALCFSAPILHRDLRRRLLVSRDHPLSRLYWTGANAARRGGYAAIYALPEHSWLPFFYCSPQFSISEYRCLATPIAQGFRDQATSNRFYAERLSAFGREFNTLWRQAREHLPIAVERMNTWLQYRLENDIVLAVRRRGDHELAGYIAIRKTTEQVVDMLVAHPAETADILAAAIHYLAVEASMPSPSFQLTSLRVMEVPSIASALRSLEFTPVDYTFTFACTTLTESIPLNAISSDLWYSQPMH